jgi:hypothetical protein
MNRSICSSAAFLRLAVLGFGAAAAIAAISPRVLEGSALAIAGGAPPCHHDDFGHCPPQTGKTCSLDVTTCQLTSATKHCTDLDHPCKVDPTNCTNPPNQTCNPN